MHELIYQLNQLLYYSMDDYIHVKLLIFVFMPSAVVYQNSNLKKGNDNVSHLSVKRKTVTHRWLGIYFLHNEGPQLLSSQVLIQCYLLAWIPTSISS